MVEYHKFALTCNCLSYHPKILKEFILWPTLNYSSIFPCELLGYIWKYEKFPFLLWYYFIGINWSELFILPPYCPILTKGSKWQITRFCVIHVFRLTLASSTSSFEQRALILLRDIQVETSWCQCNWQTHFTNLQESGFSSFSSFYQMRAAYSLVLWEEVVVLSWWWLSGGPWIRWRLLRCPSSTSLRLPPSPGSQDLQRSALAGLLVVMARSNW